MSRKADPARGPGAPVRLRHVRGPDGSGHDIGCQQVPEAIQDRTVLPHVRPDHHLQAHRSQPRTGERALEQAERSARTAGTAAPPAPPEPHRPEQAVPGRSHDPVPLVPGAPYLGAVMPAPRRSMRRKDACGA
jgi:hypothetical protein